MLAFHVNFQVAFQCERGAAERAFGPVWIHFRMRSVMKFQQMFLRKGFIAQMALKGLLPAGRGGKYGAFSFRNNLRS